MKGHVPPHHEPTEFGLVSILLCIRLFICLCCRVLYVFPFTASHIAAANDYPLVIGV